MKIDKSELMTALILWGAKAYGTEGAYYDILDQIPWGNEETEVLPWESVTDAYCYAIGKPDMPNGDNLVEDIIRGLVCGCQPSTSLAKAMAWARARAEKIIDLHERMLKKVERLRKSMVEGNLARNNKVVARILGKSKEEVVDRLIDIAKAINPSLPCQNSREFLLQGDQLIIDGDLSIGLKRSVTNE